LKKKALIRTGLGQDSHRFVPDVNDKPCVLGGVLVPHTPGFQGNSDADVLLHALTNAISGLTGKPVLGPRADVLCQRGVVDSVHYLHMALDDLSQTDYELVHVSVSIEGARPKIGPLQLLIRKNLSQLLRLDDESIALTATTGEGLTAFGKGEGVQVFCIVTAQLKAQE